MVNVVMVFFYLHGSLVGVGAVDGSKVTSSKEIEATVILAVVFEVRARDFSKVHVLSDALKVVRAIDGSFDWFIDPVLHDIESLASIFYYSNSYFMSVGIRGVGLRVFVLVL